MKNIVEFLMEKKDEEVCPKCGKNPCECEKKDDEKDDETCEKCGKKKSECTCEEKGEE